jgi:hypothetical protein
VRKFFPSDLSCCQANQNRCRQCGANSGAVIAKGGISQGYRLDLQANRISFDGAVKAATQVRDARLPDCGRFRLLSAQ